MALLRAMGEEPWDAQAEILETLWRSRELYVPTSHAVGKTWIEARAVVCWTLAWWPEVLTVCLTPTEDQLTGGIWRELQGMWERWAPILPGELGVRQWTAGETGVLALGRSPRPERPGSLQGLHSPNLLLVVDEAPEVDPRLWTAARSLLTGANTRLLAAGNPTRSDGEFYRRVTDPRSGDAVIKISAFDTPNLGGISPEAPDLAFQLERRMASPSVAPGLIDARYVAGVLADGLEPEWRSRVLAEFPLETADTLIPMSWIERARTREVPDRGQLEAGVDLARMGDDRCVIFPRRGGRCFEPIVWRHRDLMASVGTIADWCRREHVRSLVVDEGGMGVGAIDRLREIGLQAHEVGHSAAPADRETFADRRTEYWWALRRSFERDEIDLTSLAEQTYRSLAAELAAVRYTFTSSGRRQIEPKSKTKQRLRRSPDLADAMVYAFCPTPSFDAYVGSPV